MEEDQDYNGTKRTFPLSRIGNETIYEKEEVIPIKQRKVQNLPEKSALPRQNNQDDGTLGPGSSQTGAFDQCRELIEKMLRSLSNEKVVKNHQRVDVWKHELQQLHSKLTLPKVTVAVVGGTGEGKSSLINAIVDHHNILPTSGTQACTAVVVKIENNPSSDLFEADIDFLSEEEWEREVQLLKRDLTNKTGNMKKVSPDTGTEAGVAYLKMRAVYGKFDNFQQISGTTIHTSFLGKTQHIQAKTPLELREKINGYIGSSSTSTEGGQYWPIIKSVTLRLPQCDVCSTGCTLVDLPGVCDSNAARDRIAKDYLKNCSFILIVADVHRAISSKTAKEVLGEHFRRQLLMDGKYGNVAFICTKNDVIQSSELISELELHPKTNLLEKAAKSMIKTVDELNRSKDVLKEDIRNLETQAEGIELEDFQLDLERINTLKEQNLEDKHHQLKIIANQINEQQTEIRSKQKEISSICANARRTYTKTNIKKDYKAGVREMKRKAQMTQDEIDEYEEEDYISDDDENDEDLARSCDNLQVFCVSSSEYQKLTKNLATDGSSMVFDTVDDTEIPAVRQFIQQMGHKTKEEATRRLVQSLAVLIYRIQNYLTGNKIISEDDRLTVKSAIEDSSTPLMQKLSPVIEALQKDVEKEVNDKISVNLNKGVEEAVNSAVDTATHWGKPVNRVDRKKGGLCFTTYIATVNRHGKFNSPTAGEIDFNEDLANPLSTSISMVWTRFFSSELWNVLDRYKRQICITLRHFTSKLVELISANVPKSQLDLTKNQFFQTADNKLKEMMRSLNEFVADQQKNISRVFSPVIQENLKSVYDDCLKDSGPGFFQRMKEKIKSGVDNHRNHMFETASSKFLCEVKLLMDSVIEKIKGVCQELCDCLQAAFEPLWNSNEASKQMRTTLVEDITESSIWISNLCQTVGVQIDINTREGTTHSGPSLVSHASTSQSTVSSAQL